VCDYRRGLDWWIDLLTTYVQVVATNNRNTVAISKLYSSLEHTVCHQTFPCNGSDNGYSYASGSRTELTWLSLSLMLRPTVSRPVCLGIKQSSGSYDQIFVTVRQLRVWWFWAPSLTRGRVCRLQLLLALARGVILGSESRGTRYHILLSRIQNFPFRRLLRLAWLRWRYSIPTPYGIELSFKPRLVYNLSARTT
jgi:hypothetical protein